MAQPPGPQERLLRRLGLEPGERRSIVVMAALVATLLCAYTIAKVLRDSLFLPTFGAMGLHYAYIAVAIASLFFVWLEVRVGRKMPFGATRFNQFLAIAFSVVAPLVYHHARRLTAAGFYVWTGSQAMMLLPHFWLLALDLWDTRRARRVFPVLAGCGLLGGLAGGAISRWFTRWGTTGLMWTLASTLVLALGLTRLAERDRRRPPRTMNVAPAQSNWSIVRKSRYIQLLVAVLTLSVFVATLVDFQFKWFIQRLYPEPHSMTRFLGTFYIGLNLLALLFQFGAAGWLLERLSLGVSTALQPVTLLGFAVLAAFANGGWAVIALRWVQGVVQQGLGKSSTEIYFGAIRPPDRRRVKPAIDTLVERWSDAAVGVILILALRLLHVPILDIAAGTAILCGAWIGLLFFLNRQYGRAFEEALSHRWIGPDDAPDAARSPLARRALVRAMEGGEPTHIALALRLARDLRGPAVTRAVRAGLHHDSAVVRVAAIEAMEAMRLPDPEGAVLAALGDPSDDVRQAAVHFLLTRPRLDVAVVDRLLNGDDPRLRFHAVDTLLEQPARALEFLTPEWIDARIASDLPADHLVAARALGVRAGPDAEASLRSLLAHSNLDVRRAALESAARRPRPRLLADLLPLLDVPGLTFAARVAVAASGDAAVPALRARLDDPRTRAMAATTLARIASPRAIAALLPLARGSDPGLRGLGLESLMHARSAIGRPVLGRSLAYRLFLRELHDYEEASMPARGLANTAAPELRLLGDSWAERAEHALDRGFWALAAVDEPRPLFGAFARLKSDDPGVRAPALEYLGHVLPRSVFRSVARVFDVAAPEAPSADAMRGWILAAWNSGDDWLRACAVRAGIVLPFFDPAFLVGGESGPLAQAELEASARREAPVGRLRPREAA